jgi:TPR repeat protein
MSFENDEYLAGQAMQTRAYDQAVRLLRPLAERNSEYALLALGWIYETGANGTIDRDAARSFYEHAASQGSATAHHYLGQLLFNKGEEVEARAVFEEGARRGNEDCKSKLTRLSDYAEEKSAQRALDEGDFEQAVRLLRPLADRESGSALLCLGVIYERGDVGAADWQAASDYYQHSASTGSVAAYFELGRLLKRQGEDAKARTAFQAGAEKGNLPSMSRLGRMMIEGRGGPIDLDAGTAWLKRAAEAGQLWAEAELLHIEYGSARSLLEKLSIRMRLAQLALRGIRESAKNPESEKVR